MNQSMDRKRWGRIERGLPNLRVASAMHWRTLPDLERTALTPSRAPYPANEADSRDYEIETTEQDLTIGRDMNMCGQN